MCDIKFVNLVSGFAYCSASNYLSSVLGNRPYFIVDNIRSAGLFEENMPLFLAVGVLCLPRSVSDSANVEANGNVQRRKVRQLN